MSLEVKVTKTENGAILTVNGFDIVITVKPTAVTAAPQVVKVDEIRSALAEYEADLTISEEPEGIVIKPTRFLGREKFSLIAAKVRTLGGSYISAGKESRFVISKEA